MVALLKVVLDLNAVCNADAPTPSTSTAKYKILVFEPCVFKITGFATVAIAERAASPPFGFPDAVKPN